MFLIYRLFIFFKNKRITKNLEKIHDTERKNKFKGKTYHHLETIENSITVNKTSQKSDI